MKTQLFHSSRATRYAAQAGLVALALAMGGILLPASLKAQDAVEGIAADELAKRKAKVEKARELVTEGDRAMKEGRPDLAVEAYEGAREALPVAPVLDEIREAVNERYIAAALHQAAELANTGELEAAKEMVNRILVKDVAPEHEGALRMRQQLNDPLWVNPANTPEHHANVEEVNRLIVLANGAVALGRFDKAAECYEDILRIDPYNSLARRGLHDVIVLKQRSSIAAYDQTRAEMLYEVAEAWEIDPVDEEGLPEGLAPSPSVEDGGRASIQAKLKQIVIPKLALRQVTLREAVDYLRVISASEDVMTEEQDERGINFNLNLGPEDSPITQEIENKRFDLTLRNVPLGQILDYITKMTDTAYTVDEYAVTIVPLTQLSAELYLRNYTVSADFISALSEDAATTSNSDPFAVDANPNQGLLTERLPVQELLRRKGVSFPEGASATYIASSNKLSVYNTSDNHNLIERIVDIIKGEEPVIISVQVTMLKVQESRLKELGFDWLLQPYSINDPDLSFAGGTVGNTPGRTVADFSSVLSLPGGAEATASNVITNGLRSGDRAFVANDLDSIINNPNRATQSSRVAPGVLALTGILDQSNVQMVMRGLNQRTGVDTMASPSVVTRSGETANIFLGREFIYPTEYDPPELQQGGGNQFGNINNNAGPAFPVVPANPTAFETRDVGITLEVVPTADEDKNYISVTLNPEIVEFDGFVNYGSPITVPISDALGNISRATLTSNEILMPVFSTKRALTSLTVQDGATVAFGGLLTQSIQVVEDRVPILGDIPWLGRLFSSESQLPVSTAIVFLVKVDLMDPTGRPYRELGAR
ncbi:MAG: Amuc_1098 family type IV pilus outer membrane protein [Akkermansiaceae bacterium]|nr:Amuc_1098 family type IV pilus outer membrane protein [Akkermansiaceae bacterium]